MAPAGLVRLLTPAAGRAPASRSCLRVAAVSVPCGAFGLCAAAQARPAFTPLHPVAWHRAGALQGGCAPFTPLRPRRYQSGRPDLNRGPHRPERCALPGCATPRGSSIAKLRRVQGSRRPPTRTRRSPTHEVRPLAAIVAWSAGSRCSAILVLAIEPLRAGIGDAVSGDTADLREDLRGLGFGGVMITFILALAHAVIWYPAEILDLAVGYVYGFWGGLALVMVGWVANGAARLLDRPPRRAAAALPVRRPQPLRPARADGRGGRRHPAARHAPGPGDPVQPLLDRRRRGPRAPCRRSSGRRRSATCR